MASGRVKGEGGANNWKPPRQKMIWACCVVLTCLRNLSSSSRCCESPSGDNPGCRLLSCAQFTMCGTFNETLFVLLKRKKSCKKLRKVLLFLCFVCCTATSAHQLHQYCIYAYINAYINTVSGIHNVFCIGNVFNEQQSHKVSFPMSNMKEN